MLLADWGRIHRVFRAIMWLVAVVLALVIVTFASPHATGAPAHSASHSAGRIPAPGLGGTAGATRHP
jgi:hypothetical protein